ncbi:hypothetical protein MERGE_000505 [Pneumocystis wakefieldiae]|uniref:Ribosomal protein S19 n=1 Tax=Pneumocystis wakefieldiae TaxID=38082 RepID=A0A899FQB2_9ASCO|nr:hypothetical protein MERGE_000505 [Pneumocystis wakefieldiae]
MVSLTRINCARSLWKGPNLASFSLSLSNASKDRPPIKTQERSCTILPSFVGYFMFIFALFLTFRLRFLVHNGKDYVNVLVTEDMVGHKLGEFSPTRKKYSKWIFSWFLSF